MSKDLLTETLDEMGPAPRTLDDLRAAFFERTRKRLPGGDRDLRRALCARGYAVNPASGEILAMREAG